MAKKIRQIGAFLIVLILVVAISALVFVHSTTVESVKKVSVIAQNENEALVSWKHSSKMDGYNVYYCKDIENPEWKCIQVVDGSSDYVAITNLDTCSNYKFCVLGIKYINKTVYESESYTEVELFIPPQKQQIASCYSHDQGVVSLVWTADPNANGYEINYSTSEDMSSPITIDVNDSSVNNYNVSGLEVGSTLYFTVNSYCLNGEKKVVGESSDVKSITVSDKIFMTNDIDPNKPVIALTFDDGPSYKGVTTKILDLIEQYNVRATFFMIGENANGNKNNVKKMVDLGCELGNHTLNHKRYGKNVQPSDISDCSNIIYEITGHYPTAFRSTGGNTTDVIRTECIAEGMPLYYWTVDTEDWKNRDANQTYQTVINNVKDGDIVLMHDIYPSTAQAVEWLLPELINQGYQLVTVSELITIKSGNPPIAGEQYLSATQIKNNTH